MNDIKGRSVFPSIDIVKLVASFMVVALHAEVLDTTNPFTYKIQVVIFALSVPFFFVSSGYFMGRKLTDSTLISRKKTILVTLKKFIKLYCVWGGYYALLQILKIFVLSNDKTKDLLNFFHTLIVSSPGGAQWYTYAMVFILTTLFIVSNRKRYIELLLIVFFFVYLMGSIMMSPCMSNWEFRNVYQRVFIADRNFLFFGVYYYVGMMLGKLQRFQYILKKSDNSIGIVLFAIAGLVTYFIQGFTYDNTNAVEVAVFASLKVCATVSILVLCIESSRKISMNTIVLRKLSVGIFFTHFTYIYLTNVMARYIEIQASLSFIVCLLLSFLTSLVLIKFRNGKYFNILF